MVAEVLKEQNEKETMIRFMYNSLGAHLMKTSEVCAIPRLEIYYDQIKIYAVDQANKLFSDIF